MYAGKLVRLRALELTDADALHAWINDPEVIEYLAVRYPISLAAEREWIEQSRVVGFNNTVFAVETIDDSRLIGTVDLRVKEPETRRAELGIAISDKTAWGRGYGTDTMRTVCRFGFDQMNLHRIYLSVYAPNERARAMYRKVGFVEEGVAREDWYRNGAYVDVVLMGLLRGELIDD